MNGKSPLCQKFHDNPRLDPSTGKPIDDRTFKRLLRECGPIPNLIVPRPTGVVTRPMIPQPTTPQPITPQPTTPQPITPQPITPQPVIPLAPVAGRQWDDDVDDYYPQDYPTQGEFNFQTLPENAEYIQALIETGRSIFPSLETFIRAAEHINAFPRERKRSGFPLYLRDASTLEIFQIYRGERVGDARDFILSMTTQEPGRGEPYLSVFQMKARDRYMSLQGYKENYFGFARFVRNDVPSYDDTPLTQEAFRNSLTPDQRILMEAWRIKAATGSATRDGQGNVSLLRLREIRDQYYLRNPELESNRAPGIATIGFDAEKLRNAVLLAIERLPDKQVPRTKAGTHNIYEEKYHVMPTHYIMYQGDNINDERGRDLRQKKLPMHPSMSKAYYMMLYNELMTRGLLVTA